MSYSEATYFDGAHFAHIVAREEAQRLERKRVEVLRIMDRRGIRR